MSALITGLLRTGASKSVSSFALARRRCWSCAEKGRTNAALPEMVASMTAARRRVVDIVAAASMIYFTWKEDIMML